MSDCLIVSAVEEVMLVFSILPQLHNGESVMFLVNKSKLSALQPVRKRE